MHGFILQVRSNRLKESKSFKKFWDSIFEIEELCEEIVRKEGNKRILGKISNYKRTLDNLKNEKEIDCFINIHSYKFSSFYLLYLSAEDRATCSLIRVYRRDRRLRKPENSFSQSAISGTKRPCFIEQRRARCGCR